VTSPSNNITDTVLGVGGDEQQRDGSGQDGAAAFRVHGGHGVGRRLQNAVRRAGRRQVLRADQGLDLRVGHVRGARHARVAGWRGLPLSRGRRPAAHVPFQEHRRRRRRHPGLLQRGRRDRFEGPRHRRPGARALATLLQLIGGATRPISERTTPAIDRGTLAIYFVFLNIEDMFKSDL